MQVWPRSIRRRIARSSFASQNGSRSIRCNSHLRIGSIISFVAVLMIDLAVRCDPVLIRCDPNGTVFAPDFKVTVVDFSAIHLHHEIGSCFIVHVVASGTVRPWLQCSPPYVRIPHDRRSIIAFRLARAWLLHRYDRVRTGSALHTCSNARRDTTWHQLSTIEQYAFKLQRISTPKAPKGP